VGPLWECHSHSHHLQFWRKTQKSLLISVRFFAFIFVNRIGADKRDTWTWRCGRTRPAEQVAGWQRRVELSTHERRDPSVLVNCWTSRHELKQWSNNTRQSYNLETYIKIIICTCCSCTHFTKKLYKY
jgi:hypothetical protein